jgi:hypothetical protein
MSLINNLVTLRTEDFPGQQEWIPKLFNQLNPLIQSLGVVINGSIDFTSNIRSVTKDYTLTTFQEIKFQWPYKDYPPQDLRVTQAAKGTQQTPTILLPSWKYNAANAEITVTSLLEATSSGVGSLSGRYQFTIRVSV